MFFLFVVVRWLWRLLASVAFVASGFCCFCGFWLLWLLASVAFGFRGFCGFWLLCGFWVLWLLRLLASVWVLAFVSMSDYSYIYILY